MDFYNFPFPVAAGKRWTVITGDCLEVMKRLPKKFADVIITSPPYNLGISSGGGFPKKKTGKWGGGRLANGYGRYHDAMPKDEYQNWQKEVLLKCWDLLHDKGAIFYNHKPRIQNGELEHPLDWNPGLPVRQIVIWKRKGGINFSPSFYLPTHEYIIIYAKPDFRLKNKGSSGVGDVWDIKQEKNNEHPGPFPLELPSRILKTINKKNGIAIDPFAGSSTTGIAALLNGYQYIGIDIEGEYIEMSEGRLKRTENGINSDIFKENNEREISKNRQ